MDKKNILILLQSGNYLSMKFIGTKDNYEVSCIDIEKVKKYLEKDFCVQCVQFRDFDYTKSYSGYYVIYSSNEARGAFYQKYIEDVLLRLLYDGAILIPGFYYFKMHGNKALQELLRYSFADKSLSRPKSYVVGKYDDINVYTYDSFPYVLKSSSGSGSNGVRLVRDQKEMIKLSKELSTSLYRDYHYSAWVDFKFSTVVWPFKRVVYWLRRRKLPKKAPMKKSRDNAVIIQKFIPDLSSDYKVLYYYGKYYVLNRKNRKNDFRASGSGQFDFPSQVKEIKDILDYAEKAAREFDVPMMSLDIARNKKGCYLIEFQFVSFGPYTIQFADWHFERVGDRWIRVDGKDDIDMETARSYSEYLLNQIKHGD